MKGQNFASQVLSRHTFRISRKKGSDFFDHRGTLIASAYFWLLLCHRADLFSVTILNDFHLNKLDKN